MSDIDFNGVSNESFLERPVNPENEDLTELQDTTAQLRKTLELAYTKDKLNKQVIFNAVCVKKLANKRGEHDGLIRVKARIPEIHSLIPLPSGPRDYATISLYPTFIALESSFKDKVDSSSEGIPPGTVLTVTYGNMSNFEQPRLLEIGNIVTSAARSTRSSSTSGGGTSRGGTTPAGSVSGRPVKIVRDLVKEKSGGGYEFNYNVNRRLSYIASIPKDKDGNFIDRDHSKTVRAAGTIEADWKKVDEELHENGGIFLTSGFYRSFGANITTGRALASIHYTGRALDLHTRMAMGRSLSKYKVKLEDEPYVAVKDPASGSRPKWIVWAKVINFSAPKASSIPVVDLDAWVWKRGSGGSSQKIRGQYFNLTEIMKKNNFQPISALSNWKTSYGSTEWWHFQNMSGVPAGTKWRDTILQIKSEANILASKYGKSHNENPGHTKGILVSNPDTSPWELTQNWELKGNNFSAP